jgi:hypothetical protein
MSIFLFGLKLESFLIYGRTIQTSNKGMSEIFQNVEEDSFVQLFRQNIWYFLPD